MTTKTAGQERPTIDEADGTVSHRPHSSMVPTLAGGLRGLKTAPDDVAVNASRQVAVRHGLELPANPVSDPIRPNPDAAAAPVGAPSDGLMRTTAAELGRRVGKKGGTARARAAKLSPDERATSARLAAKSRWGQPPKAAPGILSGQASARAKEPKAHVAKAPMAKLKRGQGQKRLVSQLNPSLEIPLEGEQIASYVRVKVLVPDYVSEQLIAFCYQKRCTMNFALLNAMKEYRENGEPVFCIRDEDCVPDRRKVNRSHV